MGLICLTCQWVVGTWSACICRSLIKDELYLKLIKQPQDGDEYHPTKFQQSEELSRVCCARAGAGGASLSTIKGSVCAPLCCAAPRAGRAERFQLIVHTATLRPPPEMLDALHVLRVNFKG